MATSNNFDDNWTDYSHPQLGQCKRNIGGVNVNGDYFTHIEQNKDFHIKSLGSTFRELRLFIKNQQDPPQSFIDQIMYVLSLPSDQVPVIEKDAFEQYTDELYPIFTEQLHEGRKYYSDLEFENELAKLPKLESQNKIWQLFGRPETINVDDRELSLSFICNFDDEHHWNITFQDKKFAHVYLG